MSDAAGTQVTVPTPDGDMPAVTWAPPGGRGPGILLLQEIFGVSSYIRRRGAALAEQGYVVLAPELYWRLDPSLPPLDESADDVVDTAMSRAGALDWPTTVADAVTALHHLRGLDAVRGGTGIVGFCFGGGLGFNVAAETAGGDGAGEGADCLVSYYGSGIPGLLDLASEVRLPSLHHFGLADDFIDAPTVERIREAVTADGAPVRFETYEGANHAFDNDDFYYWNPEASALAWERTLAFLAEQLPTA